MDFLGSNAATAGVLKFDFYFADSATFAEELELDMPNGKPNLAGPDAVDAVAVGNVR